MHRKVIEKQILKDHYIEIAFNKYLSFKETEDYDETYKVEILEKLNEFFRANPVMTDFLVEQFNREVKHLLHRGLVKNYVTRFEETSNISGQLVIGESLPHLMSRKPLVFCEKDHYSENIRKVLLNLL